MPRHRARGISKIIPVGAILTVVFYVGAGLFLASNYITVYSNIPQAPQFSTNFNGTSTIELRVENEAPFVLPYVNPLYQVNVALVNGNTTTCTLNSMSGPYPCGSMYLDVGAVAPGQSSSIDVALTPGAENFTLQVTVFLNSFFGLEQVKSLTIPCTYLGAGPPILYDCTY